MNKAILNPEVQNYLAENLEKDIPAVILKGSPFPNVTSQELAIQLNGLKKARTKLPPWFFNKNILYPPKLNLEQTSSEITAKYKASLVSGKNLIDITGGFGVDSYFFSQKMENVIYTEINDGLSKIAAHNFNALGAKNIQALHENGIDFLQKTKLHYNWIYIDPSRRDKGGSRFFILKDCLPNIPENLDLLKEKGENILIKTSPLLDIKAGIEELKTVSEIHVVAVNKDVKELLWVLQKDPVEKTQIKTIDFQKDGAQKFDAYFETQAGKPNYGNPKKYLFEPNPAIMKSGLFTEVAIKTGTLKLHENSHLYTSKELKDFPGRRFEILNVIPYHKKNLKSVGIKKANITTRNFPKSVEAIRKELKINDGGKTYLFFTTGPQGEKIMIFCKKISGSREHVNL